jgi:hypothetical protein
MEGKCNVKQVGFELRGNIKHRASGSKVTLILALVLFAVLEP